MPLFWRRDYEYSSLADIIEVKGFRKSSLHAIFGDKHELLFFSLHYHVDTKLAPFLEVLVMIGLAVGTIRLVDRPVRTT